jgi:hypothetical protein
MTIASEFHFTEYRPHKVILTKPCCDSMVNSVFYNQNPGLIDNLKLVSLVDMVQFY